MENVDADLCLDKFGIVLQSTIFFFIAEIWIIVCSTGYSLSESHVITTKIPKYDDRLFVELRVQNSTVFVLTSRTIWCTQHALNL